MRINKHDTQGTKPLLGKGELGYDDYTAGGDTGRVYVGTGAENIALAEKLEANMMTKAQFNALADERKANRAGSGFDEMGKHPANIVAYPNVNDGLSTNAVYVNQFYIGENSVPIGSGKTNYPISLVNGIIQKLININTISTNRNLIILPTAPTIYPYDTVLTAEQIASGVVKHADASNSGLIVNGKFDVDTSGWINTTNSTLSVDSNKLKITLSNFGAARQTISTVVGKKYIIEADITSNTTTTRLIAFNSSAVQIASGTANILGRNILEFTATTTTSRIDIYSDTSGIILVDNIAVYPADAISRSDLVFLESWHEDISEKNFVYPLGNTQYLGANTDGLTGITNGNFTGFETYSLFGNFQAQSALIGKGYVWSSLTEAQKKAFISNPENNCYLDGDKTIQVRYRVRVLIGENTNSMAKATIQGKAVIPSTVLFTAPVTTVDAGLYSNTSSTYTYYGTSIGAVSIANVSRKNQGMYHPVYNANGSKKASDGNFWYNTAVSFTSISDCFDPAKLLTASGYIGTVSGRPDGLFYDQVHEGDILDLRNSSKKVEDYNRLISREFNKLVAGTYRGKEGEWIIDKYSSGSWNAESWETTYGGSTRIFISGNLLGLATSAWYGSSSYIDTTVDIKVSNDLGIYKKCVSAQFDGTNTRVYIHPMYGNCTSEFTSGSTLYLIASKNTTRTKSNTLLHCDIIGNPTNYPTAWKQNGVFGTPLIVAEDGTSLLPDGAKDTFKLSRKANATPLLCLRSTDNGATWTSFTPTFSTTTNEITLTDEPAGNLVMVYYQTHTSMAVPVVNMGVLEIGDIFTTQGSGALINTLINKSGTVISEVTTYTSKIVQFVEKPLLASSGTLEGQMLRQNYYGYNPSHSAITLYQNTNTPTVKVFPYLTRTNGKAYLNLVFKEMKHNGTTWGDSNTFNIVDNVSTTTDNNAQTVLIGQKTVELPYFIGADE